MDELFAMEGLFTRTRTLYSTTFPDDEAEMPSLEDVRKVTFANFGCDQAKFAIYRALDKPAQTVDHKRKVIILTPFFYKMVNELKFIIYTVKVLKCERSVTSDITKGHSFRYNGGQNIVEIRKFREMKYLDAAKELGYTVKVKSDKNVSKRKSAVKFAMAELKAFITSNDVLKQYIGVHADTDTLFYENEEDSIGIASIDFMALDRSADSDAAVAKYTGILLNGVKSINDKLHDKYPGFEITDDWDKYEGYLYLEAE